ncbi:MAG TPA: flagellar biosynthetic protein FliO [Terracidiphilus sp.]|jgi:hypothetical protein|nr:flagellar biosynthetic protein FliO [Terracidiphilus sp.]
MNLKISVARPTSSHRMPRKLVKENKAPQYVPNTTTPQYAPGPTPVGSSLASYGGTRKMEALKNQQITRRIPRPKLPEPVEPQPGFFGRAFSWLRVGAAAPKQLQVVETVSLGEKRFVAIVQADGRKFLIGGGTAGVSLLTQLDDATEIVDDLESLAELSEPSE